MRDNIISIIWIAVGLSFSVLNFKYRFGMRFYDFKGAYERRLRSSNSVNKGLDTLDEKVKTHPRLFRTVVDPERKYYLFFQAIYYLIGLGMIFLGIFMLFHGSDEITPWEVLIPLVGVIYMLSMLMTKGGNRKEGKYADEEEHIDGSD